MLCGGGHEGAPGPQHSAAKWPRAFKMPRLSNYWADLPDLWRYEKLRLSSFLTKGGRFIVKSEVENLLQAAPCFGRKTSTKWA